MINSTRPAFYFLTVQKWARLPELIQTNLVFDQNLKLNSNFTQNEFRVDFARQKWMSRLPDPPKDYCQRIQSCRLGTWQTILDRKNENHSKRKKCLNQGWCPGRTHNYLFNFRFCLFRAQKDVALGEKTIQTSYP